MLISIDKRRKALICRDAIDIAPMGMRAISFHSKLEPHFDFILDARRRRETWETIAQALTAKGVPTTKQAVHAFLKRRLKRRYALGAAPVGYTSSASHSMANPPSDVAITPETPQPTESPTPQSEFAVDPLTQPPKKKRLWNIID